MAVAISAGLVPVAAHASGSGPTTVGQGTVPNYPGYTWQVVFYPAASNPYDTENENVTYVYNNTGAPTMVPDGVPEWVSVNGGPWYQFTSVSDGIGGYQTVMVTPNEMPAFMDPNADSQGYGLFTAALLNTVNPPQIPVFPPTTTAPPVLDANPDPNAPNAPVAPDIPTTDPSIGDPGANPADPSDSPSDPPPPPGGDGGGGYGILDS